MPKLLFARAAVDAAEERKVHKLAASRHAPADWILRAKMIARSWDGLRTTAIAAELSCHPQTVRERLARFNAEGRDGLGDRPGAGRKRRLTEAERGHILALASATPPGKLLPRSEGPMVARDEEGDAHWTLDALVAAAAERGMAVKRSHRPEGTRAYLPRRGPALAPHPPLGGEPGPGLQPTRAAIVALDTAPAPGVTVMCADELGPVTPRTFPPPPGWSADGHRVKVPLE
jgi:transposase